jgi:terminal uridylyltransferase
MEPKDTSALEDQLRGMILSNVTIQAPPANYNNNHPAQHRGRGRGRGGFNNRGGYNDRGGPANANSRGGSYNFRPPPNHHPRPQSGPQSGPHQAQAPRVLPRPQQAANQPGQTPDGHVTQHQQQPRPQGHYAPRPYQPRDNPMAQVQHMDQLAAVEIPKVEMSLEELEKHEAFRKHLERILQDAFAKGYKGDIADISLIAFGSLGSGFGLPGSDMDLAVVPVWKDAARADETGIDRDVPRLLEKAVLDAHMGGRLLTRTRVPILKVCQSPTEVLYAALSEERAKWDELSDEDKYPTAQPLTDPSAQSKPAADASTDKPVEFTTPAVATEATEATNPTSTTPAKGEPEKAVSPEQQPTATEGDNPGPKEQQQQQQQQPRAEKHWSREKVLGPLDFPPTGVGIQCDINFENPLGIHNTHMLRCYSLTDPRVRPIVLFVKSWAKRRKINSSYSGTLSSYGWVLMVIHYLVNVAQPPVCPNLQHYIPQPADVKALESFFQEAKQIGEYNVRFWRNEQEIMQAAQGGRLSQNRQSVGGLLRGFFQYFASMPSGYGPRPPQFYWTTEVLSLRTPGGIRTKQDKGWVSAKTTITAERKVTNRYLFAIEDPFELDHNVARTVTHRGIVTIRDEFRRAWRILSAIGKGFQPEGGLFDEVVDDAPPPKPKTEEKSAIAESIGTEEQVKVVAESQSEA